MTKRKKFVLILLLLIPFIWPSRDALKFLTTPSVGEIIANTYTTLRFGSALVIYVLYIRKKVEEKAKPATLTAIIFCIIAVLCVSTIRMCGSIFDLFSLPSLLAFFMLIELFEGEDYLIFLEALYWYLTAICLLNAASIYIYPEGMPNGSYFLYGLDNVSFLFALHALFLGDILACLEGKRDYKHYIFYIFIMSSYFSTRAGTAMAVTVAYVIIRCIPQKLISFVNYWQTLAVLVALFVAIVILQNLSIFSFVPALIGKDLTFSSRTIIWQQAFKNFPSHWLLGVGTSGETLMHEILEDTFKIGHMHNVFLEYLFKGGTVCGALFVVVFLLLIKPMKESRENVISSILCCQLILSWLSCLFEYRFETYTFYLVPCMMYYINKLPEPKKKKERREALC